MLADRLATKQRSMEGIRQAGKRKGKKGSKHVGSYQTCMHTGKQTARLPAYLLTRYFLACFKESPTCQRSGPSQVHLVKNYWFPIAPSAHLTYLMLHHVGAKRISMHKSKHAGKKGQQANKQVNEHWSNQGRQQAGTQVGRQEEK